MNQSNVTVSSKMLESINVVCNGSAEVFSIATLRKVNLSNQYISDEGINTQKHETYIYLMYQVVKFVNSVVTFELFE